jgi:hypothetical protein
MEGSVCAVCGSTAEPLPLLDGEGDLPIFPSDTARPELEWAGEAWARGEYARVVSHCLSAEGAQGIKSRTVAEGPAFVAVLNGASVIIRVLEQRGQIVVETPVVRLPQTQYVGAMRAALELSAGTRSPARYTVRADALLLRTVGMLESMSPAVLQSTLRSIVNNAIDDAKVLSTSVHARAFSLKEHIHLDLDALPEERPLELASSLRGVARDPSKKPTIPAEPPLGGADPFSFPAPPVPSIPASVANFAPQELSPAMRSTTVSAGVVPPNRPATQRSGGAGSDRGADRSNSSFPPIPALSAPSAPLTPTQPGAVKSSSLRAPTGPLPTLPQGHTAPERAARADTATASKPAGAQKATLRRPSAAMPQAVVTANASAPITASPDTPQTALGELLHKAQTLGALLSFADQPASMALLIRASVYRALLEFDSALPAAVSQLWSETQALTKEIYITAPGIRRGAMAIPTATHAFDIMQRIVDARGDVPRAETPQIVPITSSQEAKQHLARYVSEIDQAPKDLELRHFLALGALAELLVRAKLPAPTLERLRGIIAHAKRDGATQPVVDLMMTALSRMMA